MSVEIVQRVAEEGRLPAVSLKPCCIAYLKTAIPKHPMYPLTEEWYRTNGDAWAYVCIVCFQRVPFDAYVAMVREVQG